MELLRRRHEVYYHKKTRECDFLVKEGNRITSAVQVTQELTPDNRKREFGGLLEAMEVYGLQEGLILTKDTETTIETEGYTISVKPVWKWLLE
jgi:hypothetical protein